MIANYTVHHSSTLPDFHPYYLSNILPSSQTLYRRSFQRDVMHTSVPPEPMFLLILEPINLIHHLIAVRPLLLEPGTR